ncbi:D-Ala-D-Ala carboxypeptidase family metallohydrolase [uncultured Aquimarina sp.]|uniref:D-Ala-D-Ala carboxypeptidase family metallohydrolase n=1 Tax=uncultured Aquimarina sp. TaxID=575652 RepID=UPI00261EDEF5|nr:D-Ala-D-Ala carboxypeptidase family metallohydrolase [uncultured Aquimarina sp.]
MIGIKKLKKRNNVIVVAKNSNNIWWAIGSAFLVISGVIIVRKLTSKESKGNIDLSKFDSPDIPGSGRCMDQEFIKMLQKLAKITKLPIFEMINSGARSPYWNKKVGGVSNSSHKMPTCKAADIKAPTTTIRNKIVVAAKLVGFKRIGVGRTFVHLDNDTSKKQYVAWGYPSGTKPPINPFV